MAFKNYRPDDAGLNQIARSPAVTAALRAVAEKGKTIAVGLSADFAESGEYASSFEVSTETIDWVGEYPGRRSAAYLTNMSNHAAAVEWGNAHDDKPHHVLGRTLGMLHD